MRAINSQVPSKKYGRNTNIYMPTITSYSCTFANVMVRIMDIKKVVNINNIIKNMEERVDTLI